MKLLARINRGAILTTVVLFAVVVYLIALAAVRNAEVPRITALVGEYINAEIRYSMLPEQYRADVPAMPAAEQEKYLASLDNELAPYLVSDEKIRDFSLKRLKTQLENQMRGQDVIYDYQKSIVKIKSIDFDQNIVNITVVTNTIFDGPSSSGMGVKARAKTVAETTDNLVLQKSDGAWHVVYAELRTPDRYQYDLASDMSGKAVNVVMN